MLSKMYDYIFMLYLTYRRKLVVKTFNTLKITPRRVILFITYVLINYYYCKILNKNTNLQIRIVIFFKLKCHVYTISGSKIIFFFF